MALKRRCEGVCKTGRQCKYNARRRGAFCGYHAASGFEAPRRSRSPPRRVQRGAAQYFLAIDGSGYWWLWDNKWWHYVGGADCAWAPEGDGPHDAGAQWCGGFDPDET